MDEIPAPTPTAALAENLATSPAESKKYQMVSRAILFTGIIGGLAFIAIVFKPDSAADLVKLATLTIGSITALVGIYTGVQGATDWKNMTALSNPAAK